MSSSIGIQHGDLFVIPGLGRLGGMLGLGIGIQHGDLFVIPAQAGTHFANFSPSRSISG